MKKRTAVFLLISLAFCLLFSTLSFAANDEINVNLAGCSFRGMNGYMESKVLKLDVLGYAETNEGPAIWMPSVNVDASKYGYIRLEMKIDIKTTVEPMHKFYFKTDKSPDYSEAKTVALPLENSSNYKVYMFDMTENSEWEGIVTGFFYGIEGDAKGEASIKSISFVEVEPNKISVLPEEQKLIDYPQNVEIKLDSMFVNTREYPDCFTDVEFNDWFYEAVVSAYEFGLVNGKSENIFEPNGTMTVAEALTLSCRMNGVANGTPVNVENGEVNWYDGYVDYAKNAGFLKDGDFDSYDREIKRHEMVSLFADALPVQYFYELNYVTHIPDVSSEKEYAEDVLMFYNAGICMGNDIYGTFNPESNITRSEVAAIVDRIADYSHRLEKELAVKVNAEEAYYLIDDIDYVGGNTVSRSIKSGWDFDNRGGIVKSDDEPPYTLADISNTNPVILSRNVTVQDAGVVVLESSVQFSSEVDGWYAEINSSSGLPVAKLYTQNGKFNVIDNGVGKELDCELKAGNVLYYQISMDLASKTFAVSVDGRKMGVYSFSNTASLDVANLKLGTTDEAVIEANVGVCRMYCNFLVNDNIPYEFIKDEWTVSQSGDMTVVADDGEIVFNGNTGRAEINNSFASSSGEIALDLIMLYPEMADGAEIAFTSCGKAVVSFTTKDGKMFVNGKELREYDAYMWYTIRLVADTNTKKALVKVSGKTVASDIPFAVSADTIDGVLISSENNGGKKLLVDDIEVCKLPVYDNYPSEPVVPQGADDYYIGINVCNLWRNGYHYGWDNISPYKENKPYLGWYDEGIPEVSDWEIKFMTEHGIDFQLVCWFHSSESPMKSFYGTAPEALFSGFMNAKYSDKYGKFALLWEAEGGEKTSSVEDFKTRFVPFWIEYFFSDPRYMVIDNKLVISVFGIDSIKDSLGSDVAVKECFDYLRETVKGMGYDDVIIMACCSTYDKALFRRLAGMGVDAVHAYNWGDYGYSAEVNQNYIFNQYKNGKGIIHSVPTVSVGFNNLAWAYERKPTMTVENLTQTLTWVRDYALDNYEVTDDSDKWKQNFVMLSTWNEYGEGTYMMPSGLNGFGYLDAVRSVFTKDEIIHEDERPDNLQMARLGHIYPINREIIRPEGYYTVPVAETVILEDTFSGESFSHWKGSYCTIEDNGGVLSGIAINNDPILDWSMPFGNLDAKKIKQVRVYIDGVVGDKVEFYWTTEDEDTWSAERGAFATITLEGMNPVVIDLSDKAKWDGAITKIRLDPITSANAFNISKIEFLGDEIPEIIQINGKTAKFSTAPIKLDNGERMVSFFPDNGIGYQLGCAYTWDKVNKRLTLIRDGNTIVYTMGSDRATVNGVPVVLEYTPYLEDGLPVIPLIYTVKTLGCDIRTFDDNGTTVISIVSIGSEAFDILNSRVPNKWEFDIDGDSEGWILQGAAATVFDGSFSGNNAGLDNMAQSGTNYDAALNSPELEFEAEKYKTLKIRMKHDIGVEKTDENKDEFELKVYFRTSTEWLSEDKTFVTEIDRSSNGEYKEYTIYLNHEKWTGEITGIRVDPFNNVPGQFHVDYIRFE